MCEKPGHEHLPQVLAISLLITCYTTSFSNELKMREAKLINVMLGMTGFDSRVEEFDANFTLKLLAIPANGKI